MQKPKAIEPVLLEIVLGVIVNTSLPRVSEIKRVAASVDIFTMPDPSAGESIRLPLVVLIVFKLILILSTTTSAAVRVPAVRVMEDVSMV